MASLSSNLNNDSSELAQKLLEVIPAIMRELRASTLSCRGEKLPLPQFRVLGNIWKAPKTNKQLAEEIGLSISAMSRVISCMESNGWVEKIENLDDRRYANIIITKAGLRLFNNIWNHTSNQISERISQLSNREKKELQNGLNVIEELIICPR